VEVSSDIPIPPSRRQQNWPFDQMEKGDSFPIPEGESKRCRNAACAYQRTHPGVRFIVRQTLGGYRAWRVE
jgi:hypothetical protein